MSSLLSEWTLNGVLPSQTCGSVPQCSGVGYPVLQDLEDFFAPVPVAHILDIFLCTMASNGERARNVHTLYSKMFSKYRIFSVHAYPAQSLRLQKICVPVYIGSGFLEQMM